MLEDVGASDTRASAVLTAGNFFYRAHNLDSTSRIEILDRILGPLLSSRRTTPASRRSGSDSRRADRYGKLSASINLPDTFSTAIGGIASCFLSPIRAKWDEDIDRSLRGTPDGEGGCRQARPRAPAGLSIINLP